jgi:tuftelin-interacting protein 11
VQKAVADWNPRNAKVSLQAIVFPWLPYIGLRLEDIVGDARRKVKNLLRSWVVEEDILPDLAAWKDVRLLLPFLYIEFTITKKIIIL